MRLVLIVLTILTAACDVVHERESKPHRERLERLLSQKANVKEVEQAVGDQPYRVATPADASEVAVIWTNPRNSPTEVREKVGRWPQTRIYLKSPMVYFDSAGIMRDFSLLSN